MFNNISVSSARRMVGHTGIYATGNILRKLVGFVMLPVYTRYLTPADYGAVGLMTFAISLIELLFGARLGMSIPKYYFDTKDRDLKAAVVSTAILITISISMVATIITGLFRKQVSFSLYGSEAYSVFVCIFSILLITQGVENCCLAYLRLQQRPWLFVAANLSKLLVHLCMNIWFVVVLKMGVIGVALGAMISGSFFSLLLLSYTFRHVRCRLDWNLAKRMIGFCWPLWIGGLAGLYVGSANRYYLRIFSSLEDVGLFELAMRFGTIITLLVWQPFAQYWLVERFRYYQRGNAEEIFQDVFRFMSSLLIVAALGISIFSGSIISVMADETFRRAAEAVPFLAFGEVFYSLVRFSEFSFLIKEKTGWMARNDFLTSAIVTIFYLLFIPIGGHVGAAFAYMFARAIQFLIVHYSARRFYDMGITLKSLVPSLIVSLIAYFLCNDMLVKNAIVETIGLKLLLYLLCLLYICLPLFLKCSSKQLINSCLGNLTQRN